MVIVVMGRGFLKVIAFVPAPRPCNQKGIQAEVREPAMEGKVWVVVG